MKNNGWKRYNCLSEIWPAIDAMNLDNRKIALFGYSRVHVLFAGELQKKKNIQSIIFVDNNADHLLKLNSGHQVIKPDLLHDKYRDYLVLIFSYHAKQMKEQLNKMGWIEGSQYVVLKDLSLWQKNKKQNFILENAGKKEISREERKVILLEMLDDIQNICGEYGLKYYLDCGTLLGSVRHNGFIPWDHDLDLMMPLEDAMALGKIVKKHEKYDFMYITNTEGYSFMHPRIVRRHTRTLYNWMFHTLLYETPIYIDLDIFGGYGNNPRTAARYQAKMRRCWKNFEDYLIVECSDKNKQDVVQKILDMQREMSYEASDYVGKIYGLTFADYFHKNSLEPAEYLLFEGRKIPVSKNYKYILEMYYGDYMTLPPIEARQYEADYTYYWDS